MGPRSPNRTGSAPQYVLVLVRVWGGPLAALSPVPRQTLPDRAGVGPEIHPAPMEPVGQVPEQDGDRPSRRPDQDPCGLSCRRGAPRTDRTLQDFCGRSERRTASLFRGRTRMGLVPFTTATLQRGRSVPRSLRRSRRKILRGDVAGRVRVRAMAGHQPRYGVYALTGRVSVRPSRADSEAGRPDLARSHAKGGRAGRFSSTSCPSSGG